MEARELLEAFECSCHLAYMCQGTSSGVSLNTDVGVARRCVPEGDGSARRSERAQHRPDRVEHWETQEPPESIDSTTKMMMTIPPLRPGMVPPFHELGPDVFEDLCRELVQAEDDVTQRRALRDARATTIWCRSTD